MSSPNPTFTKKETSGLLQTQAGYWQISPLPSVEELQSYYADTYYQKEAGSYSLEYSKAELENIAGKAALRWSALPNNGLKNGRFLDVGCGEGYLLKHANDKDWTSKGLDFSSAGMAKQNPDCLKFLQVGDLFTLLEDEIAKQKQYDVIWLQNVLEHVIDPVSLMKSLRGVLSNDGTLVVTVPNDFSVVQKAALDAGQIEQSFWVAPPDHLSYFTESSLSKLGQLTGWSCIRTIGDFPIDWLLLNENSNYVKNKTKGPAGHAQRVTLENLIIRQGYDKAIEFFSSLAALGMGRNITSYFQASDA